MNTKNIYMSLGDSFCPDCNMQYSKSENSWICRKLTNKIDNDKDNFRSNICSCKLKPSNNYTEKYINIYLNIK